MSRPKRLRDFTSIKLIAVFQQPLISWPIFCPESRRIVRIDSNQLPIRVAPYVVGVESNLVLQALLLSFVVSADTAVSSDFQILAPNGFLALCLRNFDDISRHENTPMILLTVSISWRYQKK